MDFLSSASSDISNLSEWTKSSFKSWFRYMLWRSPCVLLNLQRFTTDVCMGSPSPTNINQKVKLTVPYHRFSDIQLYLTHLTILVVDH